MSLETKSLPDLVVSKLNDGEDDKLNEKKDEEGTKNKVEEEEQTSTSSISTSLLGELSTSLGSMNDQVEDSMSILPASNLIEDSKLLPSVNDKVEDPVLLLPTNDLDEDPQFFPTRRNHNEEPLLSPPANDVAEDPLSLPSASNLVDNSLMLPSGRTIMLEDNLEDPLSLSSGNDRLKELLALPPLNEKGEEDPLSLPITSDSIIFKDPLSLPSASSLVDSIWLPLASDQVKDPLSQPPVTELDEDPLSLSPAKDKVEDPLSLPSASDHVDDTRPISPESDCLEDTLSLSPVNNMVADSPSPLSESDLVEDPLLTPSAIDRHELPSASVSPKDPLSPSNEDPLLIPSGGESAEEPLHILSDHAYPRPTEIENSIWSNLDSTKNKLEDMKPCSPAQANRKRNNDGLDSDSDSDVIYVEKNHEVIELSDDDAGECADLLTNLNVPEDVINCLKAASNKVSLQLGDLIKNRGSVNNIIVEIPTVSWSLPWVCVSGLFKNPALKSKLKKSPAKSKRKWPEGIPKKKKSKVNETSININEMKNTLCNIKKEKELYDDADRILSVIHFDPNKPPEFCEISRSGRLIKKPTRLQDDMTFFRRTRRGRKKQEEAPEEVDNTIMTPCEVRQEPSTSEDKNSETSEKSFEYSMDGESCDTWMLGLNSDSENEEVDVDDVSDLPPAIPALTETIEILSDEELDPSPVLVKLKKNYDGNKQNERNITERKRRETLRHNYWKLLREVKSERGDSIHVKSPKISILNEAINCIKQLESKIKVSKSFHQEMTERNASLFKKLNKMKKTMPT